MSDTVKLIIEIPTEMYDWLKNGFSDEDDGRYAIRAVANGIPLEDVKAEIEKQIERDFAYGKTEILQVPCHYGIANGLQNAISILDNIGKTESENKYGNSTK